jgi:hypothetical protein
LGDTTTSYVPRDFRRVCDQCGDLFNRSQLHRRRNWIFCSDCESKGTRIIEEENDEIARQRPFRILPVPNPKPLLIDNLYSYVGEEGILFDFIVSTSPARSPGGANDPLAAAWAAAYLSDVVNQNSAVSLTNRPQAWVASAKTKISSLLTYLLSQQTGSPTGPVATTQDPRYGGFLVTGVYTPSLATAAGLAFIKAYQATGNVGYLAAANRVATFLRHLQCGDIQVTQHTVYPSSGSPYHVGGLAANVNDSTGFQSIVYNLQDVYAVVFLKALAAVVGASTTYGDAASTSFFTASTQASLTTMISELTTFAETGPKDSAHGDANTPGLSATAPKVTYGAYLSTGAGTGTWGSPATVPGSTIAMSVAGCYAANGADATVTAMLAWLAAGTSNAANRTPTTNTAQQTLDAITGTYNPATAPATSLTASAPFTEATGALYDLASLGVLAPVLSGTNAAALRTARGAVSTPVQWSTFYLDLKYLGSLGRAGLSLQPHSAAGQSTPDVVFASQFGAVYRYSNP